ncbi:MAG: hypothetical protein R3F49_11885 [Planctomycetota bacterium]
MSDSNEWQGDPTPKRKGPPMWMILSGCGCLIPGFLLVALVAWGMQFMGTATSPRAAYEALAATIPYDESLMGRATGLADDPGTRELESHEAPEYQLVFGMEIPFTGGVGIFSFLKGAQGDDGASFADDAVVATITKVPSKQSGDVLRGGDDGEPFQLEFQGVTLSGMRFPEMTSEVIVQFPKGTKKVKGPGLSLRLLSDLADDPEDPKSKVFDVLLTMQRPQDGGQQISDEELRAFLAPFHIGPDR